MITAIYSILHLLVDGVCAFAMFGKFVGEQGGYEFFLIYNFCAFALQMPFGAMLDVFAEKSLKKASSFCAFTGVLLTFLGAFTHPAVLGIGNALFHVGGGVDVIREDHENDWRGQALGIFVAPGALGLFIGTQLAKQSGTALWWIVLGVACAVSLPGVSLLYKMIAKKVTYDNCLVKETEDWQEAGEWKKGLVSMTMGCFLVVILRSYVGMAVSFSWKTTLFLSTISILAVVLGKMAGGILAARLGMNKAIILSLILSAVCYSLSEFALFGIAALFFFNMTMPMTLYLLVCKWKTLPGFSFGLLTFGLFLGFLPVYFGIKIPISGSIIGMLGSIVSMLLLIIFCTPKVSKKGDEGI